VMSVPDITPSEISFKVIESLNSFFQVDHQVNISLSWRLLQCRLLDLALGTGFYSHNAPALGIIYHRLRYRTKNG
jgi:hypothetical protein